MDIRRILLTGLKAGVLPGQAPITAAQDAELAERQAAYEERMRNPSTLDRIGNILPKVGPLILGAVAGAGIAGTFGAAAGKAGSALTSSFLSPTRAAVAPPPPPPPQQGVPMFDTDSGWGEVMTAGLGMAQQLLAIKANSAPTGVMTMAAAPAAAAFPMLPRILSPLIGGAAAGAVVRAGSRLIQTAIGAISKKRVVAIAKQLGIQGAATALGLGAVEIAQYVIDDSVKKGRRGGITSAQMRTTRRTIGKVMGLHRQIAAACTSARVTRRARSCPPPKVIVTKR